LIIPSKKPIIASIIIPATRKEISTVSTENLVLPKIITDIEPITPAIPKTSVKLKTHRFTDLCIAIVNLSASVKVLEENILL